MFMTTKTHDRLLAECKEKLESAALIERNANQDALDAERLVSAKLSKLSDLADTAINSADEAINMAEQIIKNQEKEIADMQHFYNKGRAVHAADVRYEAKKRAAKLKVNVL